MPLDLTPRPKALDRPVAPDGPGSDTACLGEPDRQKIACAFHSNSPETDP